MASAALPGCARNDGDRDLTTRAVAGEADAKPVPNVILFHRTGGFAGVDDRVVIWPDGVFQATRRAGATGGRVTPEQERVLNDFRGAWPRIVADADRQADTGAPPIADGFHYTISLNDRSISLTDGGPPRSELVEQLIAHVDELLRATPDREISRSLAAVTPLSPLPSGEGIAAVVRCVGVVTPR